MTARPKQPPRTIETDTALAKLARILEVEPTLVQIAAADLGDDVRARLRRLVARLPKATVKRFETAASAAGHGGLLRRVLGSPAPSS